MLYDPSMLNIGREKQLLIDDLVIESAENICRTWHKPAKTEEFPLIKRDQPWENVAYFSCNTWQVIRDSKDGLFKCLYSDWNKPDVKPGEPACGDSIFNMLYAESEDGINWKKPLLGIEKIDGQDTNVVIPNAYDPGMILDPHEPNPDKRFKMICTQFTTGGDVEAVLATTSGDCIHWTPMDEIPTIGRHGPRLDDVIIMHYDVHGRIYVMNTRHYDMYAIKRNLNNPVLHNWTLPYYPADWRRQNKRRIWQSESSDMIHWSEPYAILTPEDGRDGLDETFYGLCQYAVGSVTLGFLNTMSYVPNTMNVRLVYSRDGKNWHHLNKRQPLLAPSGKETWDQYMVTIPSKPIEVGDELWIYHGGANNHHDWWCTGAREGVKAPEATDISKVNYGLGLAKLRLDGFASLDAGYARQGILITRPLISDGTKLQVNARCRHEGSIAAEIVDVNDKVVPGFGRKDCDAFAGDSICHTFSWRGETDIPVFATERAMYPEAERERFRKIRFFMENAEIYAFSLT